MEREMIFLEYVGLGLQLNKFHHDSQEISVWGSYDYVKNHYHGDMMVLMNMDMVGSINGAIGVCNGTTHKYVSRLSRIALSLRPLEQRQWAPFIHQCTPDFAANMPCKRNVEGRKEEILFASADLED